MCLNNNYKYTQRTEKSSRCIKCADNVLARNTMIQFPKYSLFFHVFVVVILFRFIFDFNVVVF